MKVVALAIAQGFGNAKPRPAALSRKAASESSPIALGVDALESCETALPWRGREIP